MKAWGQPQVGTNALISCTYFRRAVIGTAAIALSLMVAGCKTEGVFPANMKANAPIPQALLSDMEAKNMAKESPMLVRIFKEEAELEVWKQDRSGRYALLKTYPICRWSGDLGPKVKEGDRQAPEGFYDITPAQMNPNSSYYLAFNLGYPNAYDRSWGRTGAHLMVHGDCSSRGCYAMSDEQIQEIFAMGRESFFGGQKSFQVQAYPFRMTPTNLAKHRNSPHLAFWKMLKRGNDHFEVTRQEPKVDVCERRYVFDAQNATRFDPRGKCPALDVPQEVAQAVDDKQRKDELQFATLVARNVAAAPIASNRDGGMHPKFVAALKPRQVVDDKGKIRLVVDNTPGQLVGEVYATAGETALTSEAPVETTATVAVADVPVPRSAPQAKVGSKPEEPSFSEKLANFFKLTPKDPPAVKVASVEPAAEQPKPKPNLLTRITAPRNATAESPEPAPRKDAAPRTIGLRGSEPSAVPEAPKAKPASASPQTAQQQQWPQTQPQSNTVAAAGSGSLMSGAQPTGPSSSNFDSRWSAFR
jgi:murein L,D-transpeptidase YafK